ncbi:MAG: S9 family peptidase [Rubrivivax sp.]
MSRRALERALCLALLSAAGLALVACAGGPAASTASAPSSSPALLAPPPSLLVQGAPPVPAALAAQIERYTEFRGKSFVDWHPTEVQMLVSQRPQGGSVSQLHRLAGPLQNAQPLTQDAEPVSMARFEPVLGRYMVLAKGQGGNEAAQLYRLDGGSRQLTLLTPPNERHALWGWLPDGSRILVASVPLDRTAEGGSRAEISTTVWLTDPLQPGSRQVVATLPGGGWFGGRISPDGRRLVMTQYRSAEDSRIWLVDMATGQRQPLVPAAGDDTRAAHLAEGFSPDGKALWFRSNAQGEFLEAQRLDLATGQRQRLTAHIPWDVTDMAIGPDGRQVALRVNVDGRQTLRLLDANTGAEQPASPALSGLAGSITQMAFHRSGQWLALGVNGAQSPNQIHVLDLRSGQGRPWSAASMPPGVRAPFPEQQIIRWPSFDGRMISGLLSLPASSHRGPRPVLIDIHGGPESQATVGFQGRWNYLLQELGVAVIRPNVRGSTGYGKTFLSLDNGFRREDAVKDIGALLDWIATQPGLDARRVVVAGGSYGGYMSLAVSVHYPQRIAGGISSVGISHFLSFLRNTESYRRDLRRAEYGDERDPAMRAFLDRISPLSQVNRIRQPMLVMQGRNDPRVPYTEAEQIVAQLRAQGTPVWYLLAANEGHGFARKENADHAFSTQVLFLQQVMGLPAPAP